MTLRYPLLPRRRLAIAARVALLYIFFGCLWILLSDRLLEILILDPSLRRTLNTFKGWVFVLVTGGCLYLLVRHYVLALVRRETALSQMVTGVAESTGEDFFNSLVEHLARSLAVDFAALGEFVGNDMRTVRSVAVHAPGGAAAKFECSTEGTPCAEVLEHSFFHVPDGVQRAFPEDRMLQEMKIRGYMGRLMRDSAGKPIGVLVVMHSKSLQHEFAGDLIKIFAVRAAAELERKRSEEALRTHFDQITTIFDSLNALVYVVDIDSHCVIYMNRYGEEVFGPEWAGRHCYEVLQDGSDPCRFCANEQIRADGPGQKPLIWEFQNKVNQKWYQCIDKGIRWPDGRLVRLEIALDITERKEMERMKDEILSAVSHEMRTPLTAVLGYAEYLLENEAPPAEQRGFLRTLYQEAERLNDLISDFLQLQRLQARRPSYRFQPLPLADLLEKAARPFTVFSQKHSIRFDLPPGLPPVRGEEKSLLEVMEKLISNAVKYSPEGGEILLGAEARGDEIVLSVRDSGRGIPPGELERIFDRFYRIDNSDRREAGGAGLGLALVREIIRAHGGRVWAESSVGQGSTFFVALPSALSDSP